MHAHGRKPAVPPYSTTAGWLNSFNSAISRIAVDGTPSSSVSNRMRFNATRELVSEYSSMTQRYIRQITSRGWAAVIWVSIDLAGTRCWCFTHTRMKEQSQMSHANTYSSREPCRLHRMCPPQSFLFFRSAPCVDTNTLFFGGYSVASLLLPAGGSGRNRRSRMLTRFATSGHPKRDLIASFAGTVRPSASSVCLSPLCVCCDVTGVALLHVFGVCMVYLPLRLIPAVVAKRCFKWGCQHVCCVCCSSICSERAVFFRIYI
jgi:hypothetical protein